MTTAALLLCAYLLGSIPSALWVGQLFFHTDIRKQGSGNLGTTNTFRVLGKPAGIAVMLMDILKGTAAVWLVHLPPFAGAPIHPLALGLAAVLGHMYPVFARFRGGKAVATSGGIILGYHFPFFLFLVACLVLMLKWTKMVSLSSLLTAGGAIAFVAVQALVRGPDWPLIAFVLFLSAFIAYRHRANIARIRAGTEPKVHWL